MRSIPGFLLAAVALVSPQTPDIHFVPTPSGIVDAMLRLAHVTSDDVVIDLGSGDGRIVIAAAKQYGARGIGVELDGGLVKEARDRARKAGVSDRVAFIQGDLFKADLSQATVVTLYLSFSVNRRLESKLMSELKPGARVVSHRFVMADWPADQEVKVGGTQLYLWTIRKE
jgi:cyclopropane fatty-acyl-phospholipid synthase-like methyltransferase